VARRAWPRSVAPPPAPPAQRAPLSPKAPGSSSSSPGGGRHVCVSGAACSADKAPAGAEPPDSRFLRTPRCAATHFAGSARGRSRPRSGPVRGVAHRVSGACSALAGGAQDAQSPRAAAPATSDMPLFAARRFGSRVSRAHAHQARTEEKARVQAGGRATEEGGQTVAPATGRKAAWPCHGGRVAEPRGAARRGTRRRRSGASRRAAPEGSSEAPAGAGQSESGNAIGTSISGTRSSRP
jgi:hypothetical protein